MSVQSSGDAPLSGTRAALSLLARNRDFRLLYGAEIVSFAGDWFLLVALYGLVYDLTGSPGLVASLVAANTIPFGVATFVAGPLSDRLNRQWLMIGADVTRGVLALGFFLIDSPSQVWLVFVITGLISALGALFEPPATAAVPNLVDPGDLPTANVLSGSVWGTMLAVGAALGGLVVAAFGRPAGYVGDSASFFISAALIVQIRRPFSEARDPDHEHPGLYHATRETVRYSRKDHRVLALLAVKGGFGFATGVIGLLPVLALQVFRAGDQGTGILYAFRGLGALVGPFLFRRFVRDEDLSTLFRGISACLLTYGVFYAFVPLMPELYMAGLLVMGAHLGGGGQWTLSTYGLQRIVPDHIRGRIFAFDYGLVTLSIALSASVAGWLADLFGAPPVMVGLGCVGIAYAGIWTFATRRVRRSMRPGTEAAPA